MTGKHIISLMNGKKKIGTYNIHWSGRDKNDALITTGQYFYQLRTSSSSTTMKMLLLDNKVPNFSKRKRGLW